MHDRITSVVRAWRRGRQRKMLPAPGAVGPRAPLPSDARGLRDVHEPLASWPDALRVTVPPRLLPGTGRPSPIYSLDWDGFEPTGAVGGRRRRTGGPSRCAPVPFARGGPIHAQDTRVLHTHHKLVAALDSGMLLHSLCFSIVVLFARSRTTLHRFTAPCAPVRRQTRSRTLHGLCTDDGDRGPCGLRSSNPLVRTLSATLTYGFRSRR